MQLRETITDGLGVWLVRVPSVSGEERVRDRVAQLEVFRANYLTYLQCRIADSDWHGTWDAGVNLAETEAELAGLRFALDAFSPTGQA